MSLAGEGDVSLTALHEPAEMLVSTPAGAPKPPVCQTPVTVATVPLLDVDGFGLGNINILTGLPTYPKHATRRESNGQFTIFMDGG